MPRAHLWVPFGGTGKSMQALQAKLRRCWKSAFGRLQQSPEVLKPASLSSYLSGGVPAIPEPGALTCWMHQQVAAELDIFRDGITLERLAAAKQFYAHDYHKHY